MATQRYISTSFWDDEWIHKLDPSEKLLYLYFMTNPLTSIAGIYKLSESRICFDTGFNENTIRHIMSKFELAKKAYRFNEWIIIPNWSKHQKVKERDNIRKGIDKLLLSLPDDVFNYSVSKGYKYIYLNELDRPLQGASEPSNYLELDPDMELDSDSEVPEIQEQAIPSKPKRVKKEKEEKKTYGTFKNVFLSDTEYNALKEAYTETVVLAGIEAVSKYVQGNTGKHYSNFNKVMLSWGIEAGKEAIQSGKYNPIQNSSAPEFNVECCGNKISRYRPFCIVCGKEFNMDGTPK